MRNIRRLGALALVAALAGCAQMGAGSTAAHAGIPPSQVALNHASQCPVVSLFNPACR